MERLRHQSTDFFWHKDYVISEVEMSKTISPEEIMEKQTKDGEL